MISIKLTPDEIRLLISALDMQAGMVDEDVESDSIDNLITKLENQLNDGIEE